MKNKKIILGLVGEIASGKSSAVKYLSQKYQAKSFRFSEPIRDILKILKIEVNRRNMQFMSFVLRQNFGEDIFAKVISEKTKYCRSEIIVVDGIRRPADILYLKKMPEFKLVYITANLKIRYQRLNKRKENPDEETKSLAQFRQDQQAETEIYIKKLGKQADYKIKNNKTYTELSKQLKNIINKERA